VTKEQRELIAELINDEMAERGWTIEDLAAKSELSALRLRELREGCGPMTKIVALGLSKAFGTSMELWLNLVRESEIKDKTNG